MWKIVQNTGSQLNTGQTPVATNQIDNLDRVKLSANDSLCYVVMVSNYNGSAPSTDFKYAVKCIRSSKRPKVQVWGGDIKTDKEVITSRTSNNVNVPDENLSRIELDKTSIRAKGLWGTGLDKDGNKIGGDVHFSLANTALRGATTLIRTGL